jgi:hypothetical protein
MAILFFWCRQPQSQLNLAWLQPPSFGLVWLAFSLDTLFVKLPRQVRTRCFIGAIAASDHLSWTSYRRLRFFHLHSKATGRVYADFETSDNASSRCPSELLNPHAQVMLVEVGTNLKPLYRDTERYTVGKSERAAVFLVCAPLIPGLIPSWVNTHSAVRG